MFILWKAFAGSVIGLVRKTMLYDSQTGNMNMALTGESLITRGLKTFREERFLKLVDILVQR